MLVYGAIVPHPPLAAERVGGEAKDRLKKTHDAMRSVGEDLVSLHVDTLLLITAHGERYQDTLSIMFDDPYEAHLKAFGDMGPSVHFRPDMALIDRMQRVVRTQETHATLTTTQELDHGAAVPLIILEPFIQSMRVVVISPPVSDPKDMMRVGERVREACDQLDQRIAVICSAELSHRHAEISPGGIHPRAAEFDDRIRNALLDGNTMALLNISDEDIEELGGQGIDALRLFWGVLDENEETMQERAYEHPLGIGYLTMAALFH